MKHMGMYIHIPFCKKKCDYCDFNSFSNKEDLIQEYIKYLKQELEMVGEGIQLDAKAGYDDYVTIDTIYIGGGTPSFIDSKYILEIMNIVKQNYNISENAEITIEINPGTINKTKFEDYKKAGINRCSIGLQSENDKLLEQIGRIHKLEDFKEAYELAKKTGFENINIDFMIGLPNQQMTDIDKMLELIKKLEPQHVSVYSLIVEENTKIYDKIKDGILKLPEDDLEREMYWKVKKELEKHGYKHYEISNYAKPGFYSKHNMDCWNQKEYIGFGVGAHSYTNSARYSNITDITEFIENFKNKKEENNIIFHEKQDKTAKVKEYMILGLRKIEGIKFKSFEDKFGFDLRLGFKQEIEKLSKQNLINFSEERIFLTDKGIDFANIVWEEFI